MNIKVEVAWVKEHRWHGGECLRRLETPAYALWMVLEGAIDLTLRDWPGPQQQWHLTAGEAFLAPAPCVRDVIAVKPAGAHWLTLGLTAVLPSPADVDLAARMAPPFLWRPNAEERECLTSWIRACLAETERETSPDTELSRFIQQSLAGAVFGICWRARFGKSPDSLARAARRHLPEWLTWLLEKIEEEPGRSLAEWQSRLDVSPAQVRRMFHRYMGVSPQIYLTTRRLEAAKSLLAQTDLSAGEIARTIGFQSQAHFTRRFKSQFGQTPTQFRLGDRSPQI